MPSIKWLGRAVRDLDDINEYISEDDPASGKKVVAAVLKAVRNLEVHPQIGRAGRVPGTRELIVLKGTFPVPYSFVGDEIRILRVLRHRRVWERAFK